MPDTATTKTRSKKTTHPTTRVDDAAATEDLNGYEADLLLQQVHRSALNPRQHFDEEDLQQLAVSLQQHGQLQNITVRPIPALEGGAAELHDYELIGGERRWRAAQLAGMTTIRARVIQCSDATAVELRGIENYRRRQLNAIEEAIWFQQMINTGRFNQSTLASHLGITPGQVSNRLRLLQLPDLWQQRVIEGHCPPTHARFLCPWADRSPVLDRLEVLLGADELGDETISDLSVTDFEDRVMEAVRFASRSMDSNHWNGPKFEVTASLRKDLDLVDVVEYRGSPAKPRAFNTRVWDDLQEIAKQELQERAAQQAVAGDDSQDDSDSGPGKPPARDENVSMLSDYLRRTHFHRHLGRTLAAHLKADNVAVRLLFAYLVEYDAGEQFVSFLVKNGDDSQLASAWSDRTSDAEIQLSWQVAKQVHDRSIKTLAHRFLLEDLAHETDVPSLPWPLMWTACIDLNVSPLAKWLPDQMLLDACSTAQLRELFTEEMAPAKKVAQWSRKRLMQELTDHWPEGCFPPLMQPDEFFHRFPQWLRREAE